MAGQKQGAPIDMNNLEIWNSKFQNLGAAPVTGIGPGSHYYDTAVGRFLWRAASAWVDPLERASHVGTQLAATISNLAATVKAYKLSEFAAAIASVDFGSQKGINQALGVAATDSANVQNVLNAIAALRLNGISVSADINVGGFKITGGAPGVAGTDFATVSQVEAAKNAVDWKDSVRAATTGALTLNGSQVVDGVTPANGERVLKATATTDAGIYVVNTGGAWPRAVDSVTGTLTAGAYVPVAPGGTVNGGKRFRLATPDPITVGTTAQSWVLDESLAYVGDGTWINISGQTISLNVANLARSYVANIGDGSSLVLTVPHGLNTRDVGVWVWDNTTYDDIGVGVARPTVNSVTVEFAAPPPNLGYRCLVMARGA